MLKIEIFQKIADWYQNLTAEGKLSILTLGIIVVLMWVIFRIGTDLKEQDHKEDLKISKIRYENRVQLWRKDSIIDAKQLKIDNCKEIRIKDIKALSDYYQNQYEKLNNEINAIRWNTNNLKSKME